MYCTENKHFDTIRSSYAFHQKEGMTKNNFFQKSAQDLVIQKKVVPLHRNRER